MKKVLSLLSVLSLMSTGSLWAATAEAVLKGTTESSDITGLVKLEDGKKGLKIVAELENVPPGDHGFHIHQFGSCNNNGKSAGGHYNPKGKNHGHAMKDGIGKAHVGDLGNITIGEDGKGKLEATIKGVSIMKGKLTIAGRAFILHAKPDDFGQPTGNAGGRIGCGSIYITGN